MELKKIKIILPLAEEDVYALAEANKRGAFKQAQVTTIGINTIPPDMLRLSSGVAMNNQVNAKFKAESQQLKAFGVENTLEIHNATYVKPAIQRVVGQAHLTVGPKHLKIDGIVTPADLLAKQKSAATDMKLETKVATTEHDAVKKWRKKITEPDAVAKEIKHKAEPNVESTFKLKR
jgi:hypothetical protein